MQSESSSTSKVGTYGLLAKVELKTLQSIKIAIKRSNISNPSRSPLKRSLDSPESLKVHLSGSRRRCLFDREDVIVNTVEIQEEESEKKERCRSKERYRSRSSSPKKFKSSKIFKEYVNGPPEDYYREKEEVKYGGKVYPSTSKDYGRRRSVSPRDKRERSLEKYRKRSRERSFNGHSPPERHRRSPSYDYKSRYRRDSPKQDEKRRSKSPYPVSKKKYYYRKSMSPPLKPGEYRPKREKSKSPRHKHEEYRRKEYREGYRRVSRSPSPKYSRRSPYSHSKHSRSPEISKSRRKYSPLAHSASTSKRRSQTPLRLGEYRPSHKSRTPPLRPGEYRPPKRKSSPEYRPEKYENEPKYPNYSGIYDYSDFGPMVRPPFMPRFIPRGMFRPGQILVPHVQFIPVPPIHPMRSQMIRPPKIYNNRAIPRLVTPPRTTNTQATSTSEVDKEKKNGKTEEKTVGKEDEKSE